MRLALVLLLGVGLLWGQRRDTPRGEAGKFDFYVLSLSWSPQHCSTPAGERDRMQCGGTRQYDFILHGLWPQYERSWPQFCETNEQLSKPVIDGVMDIMPSAGLIRHEWRKHGVCSGDNAARYFDRARRAFQNVKIPAALRSPKRARTVALAVIQKEFVTANPGLPAEAVTVNCSGRFLQEVRVCLTRDLKARACSAEVARQACRLPEIIVQPLR
jgi:ribonuclease T2